MSKAASAKDVSQCENNLQTFVDVSIITRYPMSRFRILSSSFQLILCSIEVPRPCLSSQFALP
ncbi:hypothetical protein BN1049_03101 [Pseudomonas saudimassiliensis]|uniref:Uncharacterized protein n=1 Tax=Pseudomonas saudimassiliensis TaxID=1461581 RepID=A0A078MKN8_9PSED|nr:hypothetical protein BN1049_03101 [Pseudomonas saudimassiliensis]CEF28114.1 hypothetical protein BN1049_03101 [Pseudomonas saudimassiliensis]